MASVNSVLKRGTSARATAAAWLMALAVGGYAPAGWAATSAQPAARKALPSRVSVIKSSSTESEAARSKRLKRECAGRANAGACLGFAH